MPTRRDLLNAARSYEGVRFHHQGRSRGGLDCAGLIVCAARDCGVELSDRDAYTAQPDGHSLAQALRDAGLVEIAASDAVAGDALLFVFETNEAGDPLPGHVGLLCEDGELLHAFAHVRKVTKHKIDAKWRARIVSAWRIPGFEPIATEAA